MMSIYYCELVLLFFIFHHFFYNSNVDNFFKGFVKRSSFSRNEFLNYDSFIYHEVNILNISHKNVLSSSDHFYAFSFIFVNISFLYTVFLVIYIYIYIYIYYVSNITNITDNNLYITGLLNFYNIINLYTVIVRRQGRASHCFNKKIISKNIRFL